jgi:hypothetical protein
MLTCTVVFVLGCNWPFLTVVEHVNKIIELNWIIIIVIVTITSAWYCSRPSCRPLIVSCKRDLKMFEVYATACRCSSTETASVRAQSGYWVTASAERRSDLLHRFELIVLSWPLLFSANATYEKQCTWRLYYDCVVGVVKLTRVGSTVSAKDLHAVNICSSKVLFVKD